MTQRYRRLLLLVFISILIFLAYAAWLTRRSGAPNWLEEFVLDVAILGPPFALLLYDGWAGTKWREWGSGKVCSAARVRIALTGLIVGAGSAVLLLVLPLLWDAAVIHTSFRDFWVIGGMLMAVAATLCGIVGAPKLRRPALFSSLLLPFWFISAALLLKAATD